MDPKLKERFDAKWREDPKTGCWIWTASIAGKGYGQLKIPGARRQVYAHRLAWELAYGPIPEGFLVCHRCDTPRCVNPAHLFLGSHADNLQDMASKDRHLKGERNAQAKMTEAQVEEVFDLRAAAWSQREIAERFGVGQMNICRILRGDRWRHVYEKRRQGK